jgi:hypothetical protein
MSVKKLTPEQQKKIEDRVIEALRKSFRVGESSRTVPMWQNLLFLLDKYNNGNYYGTIAIKILGISCNDAREVEVTHKLVETYDEVLNSPGR